MVVAIKEHFPAGLVQRAPGTKQVIVIDKKQDYMTGLNRFMDEARTLAKFSSNPNIVKVENYFEESQRIENENYKKEQQQYINAL